ncbi:protein-disulfide reductase DsbD [Marinospirillum sp.]|uniref:protein-disulfide reductase DsbD n=1 Tax=Marinospirillum sp. TaxID=2183934 RepID=UPI0028705F80|nr:protein-disulfide reductase DsbD [Marinospirillum sp.]MDR9467461.1 protein-disulfide reductase DsbD [Marinospirillum sp.]
MTSILNTAQRLTFLIASLLALTLGFSSVHADSLFEKGSERFGSWFSDSSGKEDFLSPEQAFQSEAWVEGSQVFIRWDIAEGYYLYRDQLEISLEDDQNLKIEQVDFSSTITNEDEYFGVTEVYYDTALMAAQLSGERQTDTLTVNLRYQGCADAGLCYPPQRSQLQVDLTGLDTAQPPQQLAAQNLTTASTSPDSQNQAAPATSSSRLAEVLNSGHFWLILSLFFVAGLGLTFTPCVLPMLPILSAIIIGKGEHPKSSSRLRGFVLSLAYVLGMALTYALIGALMGLFGAGLNIQAALQSPWLLIPFALLFVLLALAMFGVWELRLPGWLDNRLQALQQPRGSTLFSVASMGALSTLVVSPCMSAPLAGALVFIATTEDALTGAWALLAMGLGMGLPLIIAGTFGARWLPKAGIWMNQVKSFFGLMLLIVAIWLVERLLPAAAVLAIWGLLALGVGVFIGGLNFRVAGHLQKLRLTLGLALIIYGGSLLVGALAGNNNPLQPLAGIGQSEAQQALTPPPLITDLNELQQIINTSQQPVMVDLYADWCISCKVMENRVFPHPDVQAAMQGINRIKFDLTKIPAETRAWMNDQQLFGPPTFMFFDQGKEWRDWRIQGEMDAQELSRHLQAFQQAL